MPEISGRNGHIDAALSDFAVMAFDASDDQFVVDRFFPVIDVPKQSDKYWTLESRAFQTDVGDGARRAPRTKAKKVTYAVNSNSFYCDNYALSHDFGIEEFANLDAALRGEQRTRLVVHLLKRAQEQRVANIVTSVSNIGSGVLLAGAAKWSDYTASDPIADITSGAAFIRATTGMIPNKMLIDWDTYQLLGRHPVLLDMYKYTSGGTVGDSDIAKAFKVDEIVVAKAIKENQPEGATTSSLSNLWGNNALLAYVPPGNPSFEQPAAGLYRFRWGANDIYPGDFGVLRTVYDGAGSEHVETIEVGHFQAEKVVARNMMYLIGNTI
jgi:hypothetical protein